MNSLSSRIPSDLSGNRQTTTAARAPTLLMTNYALTFPQLIAQLSAYELGDDGTFRVRACYDLAELMSDGLYRSQGCAFINHLVRTASIVLAHGGSVTECLAAMLHSAYMLDSFQSSRRRAFRHADRAQVSRVIGTEAEEIVWEYHRLDWGKREIVEAHIERLPSYDPVIRSVLFTRLANELEDYLDLAVRFRPRYSYRNRIASLGEACIDLANRLDLETLGEALRETYDATLAGQVPDAAVRKHINAYELPRRHFNEMSMFEYAMAKSGKLLGKFNRSG